MANTTAALKRIAITDPRWVAFVINREDALAFHRPEWTNTLASTYGFEAFVLALTHDDGSIKAGLPTAEVKRFGWRHWLSLPFSDVCPPLGDQPGGSALIDAVFAEVNAGNVRGVEIRSPIDQAGSHESSRGVIHTLTLSDDVDAVRSRFSKSRVLRNIARAQRERVVVREADSRDDLLQGFLSLHRMTRRRQGLPTQPSLFFEHLWNEMIAPGHGFVLLSYVDGTPAAAAVFLLGGSTVTYKYGASDPRYWPQRPNHILFSEAIRWSCEHGYRLFDFGRSDWDNGGLRSFKAGWGAEERELLYSSMGKAPLRPTSLGVSAVQPLLRHSPTLVNRVLGRLLYRFAA